MATHVSWPSSSAAPYEIRVVTNTSDHGQRTVAAGSEEFDRFKDVTRRLLAVSNGELAEKAR